MKPRIRFYRNYFGNGIDARIMAEGKHGHIYIGFQSIAALLTRMQIDWPWLKRLGHI